MFGEYSCPCCEQVYEVEIDYSEPDESVGYRGGWGYTLFGLPMQCTNPACNELFNHDRARQSVIEDIESRERSRAAEPDIDYEDLAPYYFHKRG